MRRDQIARIHHAVFVTLLMLSTALLTAAPTRAATTLAPGSGDTLTLALANGTSFVYAGQPGGTPAPRFTATLVLAAPPTGNYFMQVIVTVGGKTAGNGSPPTQNGLTYTFTIDSTGIIIPAGSQTAVASFYNASTNTTDQSNTVAFTITRATPQPQCTINNYSFLSDPGQTLQVGMSFGGENPNAPVDWQDATYQITFFGTANDTFPSGALTPNNQDVVTIQTPLQYDWYYRIDCTFNGTANFAPATTQASAQPVLVSAKHPLGEVDFTSVPWPLVANQTAQVDIVVHATAGGPVPNGYVSIRIGQMFTPYKRLDPNGELAGTLQALGPGNFVGPLVLYVDYQGDPYYNAGSAGFPMPSAPTSTPTSVASAPTSTPTSGGPGGARPTATAAHGGSGGGSGGGARPTATVTRTPSPAGTATAQGNIGGVAGIATGTSVPPSNATQPSNADGTGLPWWLVPVGVLALLLMAGGGGGSWLYLSRRAAGSPASQQAAPLPPQGHRDESD